jgi:sulfhydrogenase subunit beta (sulfur reductase)
MTRSVVLSKLFWDQILTSLLNDYEIYAPLLEEENQEYALIRETDVPAILYNKPKPTSPLKTFFLPVKENVSDLPGKMKPRIILGVPACDLAGLGLLDEIYLDESMMDPFYRLKRESTLLIGTDCHSHLEHCHCTSYDIKPFPEQKHDLALSLVDKQVYLATGSEKGEAFLERISKGDNLKELTPAEQKPVEEIRNRMVSELKEKNKKLPGYGRTGVLVNGATNEIWEQYAKTCVSCGACATICPTCTCFLLIDRPDFEKVKQLDACQYPGFERVAAGEDPLRQKAARFRNRYLCKYVWRPEKFKSTACTGCGRCIEACIGKINKNELFLELSK